MTLTPAQSQQMLEMLADILAAARVIKKSVYPDVIYGKADSIISTAVKLSALVPVTEEHE